MDNMRLVFPPVPASLFAAAIFGTYLLVLPVSVAQAIFAGTILGYMAYDLIHYYIHHATPHSAYFSSLKRYHVKHHFEKQQLGKYSFKIIVGKCCLHFNSICKKTIFFLFSFQDLEYLQNCGTIHSAH